MTPPPDGDGHYHPEPFYYVSPYIVQPQTTPTETTNPYAAWIPAIVVGGIAAFFGYLIGRSR